MKLINLKCYVVFCTRYISSLFSMNRRNVLVKILHDADHFIQLVFIFEKNAKGNLWKWNYIRLKYHNMENNTYHFSAVTSP